MGKISGNIHDDVRKVLLTEEQIRVRVHELGRQISEDYAGKEIIAIFVLRGASVFFADLIRQISVPMAIDTIAAASYGDATKSSGTVRIDKDIDTVIEGKHVLLVEDIIDTGLTLSYLKAYFLGQKPASFRIVTLLDKPAARKVQIAADYNGFLIGNEFVVGYGLDYAQRFRNLPYIAIPKEYVWNSESKE
jgi:hypoxanthine phosphoribosyltransferase